MSLKSVRLRQFLEQPHAGTLVVMLLMLCSIILYFSIEEERIPQSWQGVALGISGIFSVMFCTLLWAQKQTKWKWLRWAKSKSKHSLVGILSFLCSLLHCNFCGGGDLTRVTLFFFIVIIASGLIEWLFLSLQGLASKGKDDKGKVGQGTYLVDTLYVVSRLHHRFFTVALLISIVLHALTVLYY